MQRTRHVHMLMEPQDYQRLESIARGRRTSVAELVRSAVRQQYLDRPQPAQSAVDRLAALQLDLPAWDDLANELQEAKIAGLS